MTKMKMAEKHKPLLASLREKKRYIAYRVHASFSLPAYAGELLVEQLNGLLGVFEAARGGLVSVCYDAQTRTGVLRTSNECLPRLRSAMLLVRSFGNSLVMVEPLLVSGVLKKCKNVR